ncbi:carbonic anhydrase 7-like [Anopheles ziemanni]|uniref:carbonic anhydrase 7-like n=1 Tax=Anopheles coustani TaxID=139045 RepID=UPI002657BFFC|nr:carbonic anhydrase 7-like [Anopheles coustani]XP_058170637.1 carbonic anhydrase 7-like [Anopheles ziemanni]
MSQESPDNDVDQSIKSTSSLSGSIENEALVQSLAATESYLPAPIDLNINGAEQIELESLRWENYDRMPESVKLTNTGETVILSARWAGGIRPFMLGGPLADRRYVFSQLHFHWGLSALDGSEHTIDGYPMPLELHVIHFDERLGDQRAAESVPGGVVCLVYLFRLQSSVSRFMEPIVNGLKRVRLPNSYAHLEPFPLDQLFHTFSGEYFLYWGSTIAPGPPAYLVPMLWIVSRTQERLSFRQLKQFNRLLNPRMLTLVPSPRAATSHGRHLFHVNPTTPMAVATLRTEPPPKYLQAHRDTDRIDVDWNSPDACRRYVALVREELAKKRNQFDTENCPENSGKS